MFHCQRDSFARELETEVISCKPATRKVEVDGKKTLVNGCDLVCQDTVIFPEGGGQNSDKGTIKGIPVVSSTRVNDKAVHFLSEQVNLLNGERVVQIVDWERRWDNMQQHSGQHLISAILEREFGISTVSWWMAENSLRKTGVSYIEVDKPISEITLSSVENRCNSVIQSALPVNVSSYEIGDPALEEAHTRGLPADHTGPIRVVSISGVDSNLCCGTHVSCTSQLQIVKLLNAESKKDKHWLYFLVGGRVSSYFQSCLERERLLVKILNNAPEEHVDLIDKMQRALKTSLKCSSNLLKEIAINEANRIKLLDPKPKFCVIHKKEGDSDFISSFLKELDDNEILCVLTVGDEKQSSGQLVVTGNVSNVQEIGKRLCSLLDGKGGGKGKRFNAKIHDLKKVDQIEKLLESLL